MNRGNGFYKMPIFFFFSATMCASDAVAALTLIKADVFPKLFSLVFGEGLVKQLLNKLINKIKNKQIIN